ncbi:hypothetical protein ABBQ32_001170 [Trebouxia sp. C0010 RCD-2024]
MASVRRAVGTVKEGAELAGALALSQPRITGTGSSQKFDNPWPEWQEKGLTEVFGWAWKRRGLAPATGCLLEHPKPTPADFARAFPVSPPNYAAKANPPGEAVQAFWLGHASCLVQMEGFTFLTDPVFSQRCSPVQWMGPRRVVQPALSLEDPKLPPIDFVLISHNHYDHLDYASVMQLHKRFGKHLAWYVPLGLARWFKGVGVQNVHEMGWWQEAQLPQSSVTLACLPAQHWSSRSGTDRRQTLWCGWAVMGAAQRFWFAGDTGYCGVFKEIGQKYGPFDLSAIPIGAYDPRWLMKPQHIDPAEAVQIHQDVKSHRSFGIHCCTFNLTDEPLDEPPQLLIKAVEAAGLPPDAFVALQHGAMLQTANGVDLQHPLTMQRRQH